MKKSRGDFIRRVSMSGGERKPKRTPSPDGAEKLSRRGWRIAVREAALRGVTCIILYRKTSTSEVKRYEVIPTEYAYKRMKENRLRKVLWVQDCHEGRDRRQIKCFVVRNIIKAAVTDRKRKSKWPVKIK